MDNNHFSQATGCHLSTAKVWRPVLVAEMEKAGIRDRLDICMLLALSAANTEEFSRVSEEFNYSSGELRRLFPGKFSPYQASMLGYQMLEKEIPISRQRAIANLSYSGRAGNTDKEDGWNFRSRGLLPVRGRRAYSELSGLVAVDLIANPDELLEPEIAARAACALFVARGGAGVRNASVAACLFGLSDDAHSEVQANYRRARAAL